MLNEIRKFYKSPAVMILFVMAMLLSALMPIFFINDYESYDYAIGEEIAITGLAGFENSRKNIQKISGLLSIEKLNDALTLYKSSPKGESAYFAIEEEYPGIYFLLRQAYIPYTGSSEFQVSQLANVNDFYDRNVKKVEEKIEVFGMETLSEAEKKEALKRAAEIEKPYNFEFVEQWPVLIKSLFIVYFVIVFSAIIIANQLFSFEKEQNMDIILNAAGKKKLISIGFKKLVGMLAYLTVEFLICSMIVSSIVFAFLGSSGWHSQIQILPDFFTIIYNLSIGELYLYSLLIALVTILCIASVSALINATFQKTYTSLIVSSLLIIPPMFLRNSEYLTIGLKKFLTILPINGINLFSFIDSLFSYKLFDFRILTSTAIILFAVVCSVICIAITPFVFKKRMTRN